MPPPTDLADYLVKKVCPSAMPTKPWHWRCALPRSVASTCPNSLEELKAEMAPPRAVPLLDADVASVLTIEGSLSARDHIGGPRRPRCEERLRRRGHA